MSSWVATESTHYCKADLKLGSRRHPGLFEAGRYRPGRLRGLRNDPDRGRTGGP